MSRTVKSRIILKNLNNCIKTKKSLLIAVFLAVFIFGAFAGKNEDMKLHVDGKFLKNEKGKTVRLSGFHTCAHPAFTGLGRRGLLKGFRADDPKPYLDYFKNLMDVISDPTPRYGSSHGWYANQLRIPGNSKRFGSESNYVNNFLVPLIEYAKGKGVYIVLCIHGLKAKSTTPEQLKKHLKLWDYLSSHPKLKNASNVQFELTNEPIKAQAKDGTWGAAKHEKYHFALVEWLQPLVDKIRSNGAKNVIWVPGLAWQSCYEYFPKKTIIDPINNFGYAIHIYPAYGGIGNDPKKIRAFWNKKFKPVANTHPINITEMWWKKMLPGDHKYHKMFDGVTGDEKYGFGTALHGILKENANISWVMHLTPNVFKNGDPEKLRNSKKVRDDGSRPTFEWQYEFRNK